MKNSLGKYKLKKMTSVITHPNLKYIEETNLNKIGNTFRSIKSNKYSSENFIASNIFKPISLILKYESTDQ